MNDNLVKTALRGWLRALRILPSGRIRRGAAAAAAVTLAAGMAAAPAAAAPSGSSTDDPQSSPAQRGTQLAQMMEVEPDINRGTEGRGFEPDPFEANRALEDQFRNDAELQRAFGNYKNYKNWNDRMREMQQLQKEQELHPDQLYKGPLPDEQFFESNPPGPRNEGPSLLPGDQRQAINKQLAKEGFTEPLGYLNPYDTSRAIGPAKEAAARLAGDKQWLGDQLQAGKLPADTRNAYQLALNDILSRISQAEDQDHRNALIDQFNSLKDDYNRAEMTYRDDNNLFGEDGRQVPRALDPGLPEPAPENLRAARAALEAMEQQQALDAARERALEPGEMTGGAVNDGTDDTNPGPVGGDPAKALAAAQERALAPGEMAGGGVNTGTPDNDPGSVGGDPAKALAAAQEHALAPGEMTGGGVNTDTPDNDPGSVGGDPGKAAPGNALAPGEMTGGGVNTGTPDTNPGPVGGNGQDDSSTGTTGAVDQGRITDTEPHQSTDTPAEATGDPNTDNSQTSPGVQNTVDGDTSVHGDNSGETKSSDDSRSNTDAGSDTGASESSSKSESDSDTGGTGSASESTDSESTDSESTDSESTDSDSTDSDSTDSDSTDSDSTDSDSTDSGGNDSGGDSSSSNSGSTSYGGGDSSGDSSGDGGSSSSGGGDGGSSSSSGGGDGGSSGGGGE